MLGYIHQLLPAMTGILGVATVWADAGYLPRTGPPPLRFRASPPPIVSQVSNAVAPPFPPPFLPPYFPPAPIALPTPPMPSNPPDASKATNTPPASVITTNGPALEFDARPPILGVAPEQVVSPQMLLKYFTTSTNAGIGASTNAASHATTLGVIGPLGFTPPPLPTSPPPPPPASKATYSTSP